MFIVVDDKVIGTGKYKQTYQPGGDTFSSKHHDHHAQCSQEHCNDSDGNGYFHIFLSVIQEE